MTDPLVSSVEELSKALNLAMRFIQPDDVDEFASELQKLGIEPGIGARAKEALEARKPLEVDGHIDRVLVRLNPCVFDDLTREDKKETLEWAAGIIISRHPSLTPREIKMAGFLAGDALEQIRSVERALESAENWTPSGVYQRVVEAKTTINTMRATILSIIQGFTEAEAVEIRKATR